MIIAITIVHGIRFVIYSIGCLVVDIGKSLQEQSYILLVSIESLEKKLSTMKPDSKEYKDTARIIKSQKELTQIVIGYANQLSDQDMKSVDQIRKEEIIDNDIMEESKDNEDSNSTLDI